MMDLSQEGTFVWLKYTDRLHFLTASQERREEQRDKAPVDNVLIPKRTPIQARQLLFLAEFNNHVPIHLVRYFVKKFQRKSSKKGDHVTMNDVKDIAIYTFMNNIPKLFLDFFYSSAVDIFLRSLFLYFAYFQRIWYIVYERRVLSAKYLRHPLSRKNEKKWRRQLSDLRFILARDYCNIVRGALATREFHHTKTSANVDRMLFELLYKFSFRVVEVGLNDRENPVLLEEFNRLFRVGGKKVNRRRKYSLSKKDIKILESPFACTKLQFKSPLVKELFRPNRHRLFNYIGLIRMRHPVKSQYLMALELGLLCKEEHFKEANVLLGILGKIRSHYDPLLTFKDDAMKAEEDIMHVTVRHRSIFTSLNTNRFEADAVVAKRSYSLPYKSRPSFFTSQLIDGRREQHRVLKMWKENAKYSKRLKTTEAGEPSTETAETKINFGAGVNFYDEMDDMIKNCPFTDSATLKVMDYIKSQMNIHLKKRRRFRRKNTPTEYSPQRVKKH